MAKKYLFKLYISSRSFGNKRICENLKSILDEKLKDQYYSLEIIDITEDPAFVLKVNVFSTPALVRQIPSPPSTVVGNFLDREKLSAAVEILIMQIKG